MVIVYMLIAITVGAYVIVGLAALSGSIISEVHEYFTGTEKRRRIETYNYLKSLDEKVAAIEAKNAALREERARKERIKQAADRLEKYYSSQKLSSPSRRTLHGPESGPVV